MKLSAILLSCFIALSCIVEQSSVYGQTDSFSERYTGSPAILSDSIRPLPKRSRFDEFLVGARVNYIQGKYGFLGCAAAFSWHEIGYVMASHIGFSAGMDFRLTKSMVYVPKITVEYRFLIGVVRLGYNYFTDFKSDFDHRISAEIGLSFFSFVDVTYLHSFGSKRNPFGLNADYLNLTVTLPLNM